MKSMLSFNFIFPRYEEERAKLPRKGASREEQTLALLQKFTAKMTRVMSHDSGSGGEEDEQEQEEESEIQVKEEEEEDASDWSVYCCVCMIKCEM